ncbi:hypothetical protein GCM10025780_36490 [Frondihabitans cladoniiphilus]|uniref:Uncharacterized protein n=2 Tax=Frondihabitans cladoniiphilus TaxID=715785 RepID=A0ABP8WCW3_9MICO
MTNARSERVAASAGYGRAMAVLEHDNPEMAAAIQTYVTALHAEAAGHRLAAKPGPIPDPFTIPGQVQA